MADSGTQARRYEEELGRCCEEDPDVASDVETVIGFCCNKAINPGILSFEDGVGWIYT
jgi:hypothetical protein